MNRTKWLQETRKMSFEEAFFQWQEHRLSQVEAARLLVYMRGHLGVT